jgi:chaperonin GroEL
MKQKPKPGVRFQPGVHRDLQNGINQIVSAVIPTLGPRAGWVVSQQVHPHDSPEILDDGGLIARRIVQLPHRAVDVGAMMARQLLWRMREVDGDGSATAAVLLHAVFNQGLRYLAAGGNAVRLRAFLEEGVQLIEAQLDAMAFPLDGKEELSQMAESTCHDPEIAAMMGEIFDIIGVYGRLEIRSGQARGLDREYFEGMYWSNGVHSSHLLLDDNGQRTNLETPHILVSDLSISDPEPLARLVANAKQAGAKSMLLVCKTLSDKAIAVLLSANKKLQDFKVTAVRSPGATDLQDLAFLTGGQLIVSAAGYTLDAVRAEDLGRARRAWANKSQFGIVGGKVSPRLLRQRIAELRAVHERAQDVEERENLEKRLAKLLGGSATLYVGGATDAEIKTRKALVEQTARTMRQTIRTGALPGGGVALLVCQPMLAAREQAATDSDERAAYHILSKAVEAPMRAIVDNAGLDAGDVMAEVRRADPGWGCDVRSGEIVDMAAAGIYGAAAVQKSALRRAVNTAALALTVDVLVLRRQPPTSMTP